MRGLNHDVNLKVAKVEAFIQRAYKAAEDAPINIMLKSFSEPDEVYISWFEREGGVPGDGKKYLEKICEFADQMHVILCLTISPKMKNLIPYYEAFHFVQDGPEDVSGFHMYRYFSRPEL